MIKFIGSNKGSIFDNWSKAWPPKEFYSCQQDVTKDQYNGLKELIDCQAGETELESFLGENREVLSCALSLYSTGHHASWIFPKYHVRSCSSQFGGMIPDYIMAGSNSEGLSWWILELKGANHKAFAIKGKRVYLSQEANKGVCQLLAYIDASARAQSYLRDEMKLKDFREPKGILLIGSEIESGESNVQEFKGAWNRSNATIKIRSYSALLRIVRERASLKGDPDKL